MTQKVQTAFVRIYHLLFCLCFHNGKQPFQAVLHFVQLQAPCMFLFYYLKLMPARNQCMTPRLNVMPVMRRQLVLEISASRSPLSHGATRRALFVRGRNTSLSGTVVMCAGPHCGGGR